MYIVFRCFFCCYKKLHPSSSWCESLLLCGLLPLLGRSCSVPLGEFGFGPGQRSAYSVDYEKGSGFECSGKDVLCHANPAFGCPPTFHQQNYTTNCGSVVSTIDAGTSTGSVW